MGRIIKIDVGDHKKLEGQIDRLLRESWEQGTKADFTSLVLPSKQEVSAIKTSVSAIKRSLMSFDKLNRLAARSSGSSSKKTGLENTVTEEDTTAVENMALQWKKVLDQLGAVNQESGILKGTLGLVAGAMAGAAAQTEGFRLGLEDVEPAAKQANSWLSALEEGMTLLKAGFYTADGAASAARQGIEAAFYGLDAWFRMEIAKPVKGTAATLWEDLEPGARSAWRDTKSVFSDAGSYFSTTFGNAWETVRASLDTGGQVYEGITGGVLSGFKKVVNKLIAGVNDVVVTPFTALNEIFKKLRSYNFEGQNPFAGMIFSLTIPAIPLLAKGAVLPANKPFMAVVGDQKHGTNVEAPLETIQQAVANVMGDVVEADMAGHNATVQVLRQILEAVLGISLDEGTVARAVERHQSRMAVVTGGF